VLGTIYFDHFYVLILNIHIYYIFCCEKPNPNYNQWVMCKKFFNVKNSNGIFKFSKVNQIFIQISQQITKLVQI